MERSPLLIITSARNEEAYITNTINSIIYQTVLPREWIIIDDGSTDNTAAIVEGYSRQHSWIKLVKQNDRGYREVGYGAVEALYNGLANVDFNSYEYLSLIDADIVIERRYIEILLNKFDENKNMGIASGKVYELNKGTMNALMLSAEMVAGAVKTWRRKCFEDINGLVKHMGWDGIDCYKAIMKGWQTRSFPDKELQVLHLRQLGSSYKSVYHAFVQRGRGLYFMGAQMPWLFASALFHVSDRPCVFGSLFMIIGYVQQLLMRAEQYSDPEFIQWLRKWQKSKLIKSILCLINRKFVNS